MVHTSTFVNHGYQLSVHIVIYSTLTTCFQSTYQLFAHICCFSNSRCFVCCVPSIRGGNHKMFTKLETVNNSESFLGRDKINNPLYITFFTCEQ